MPKMKYPPETLVRMERERWDALLKPSGRTFADLVSLLGDTPDAAIVDWLRQWGVRVTISTIWRLRKARGIKSWSEQSRWNARRKGGAG